MKPAELLTPARCRQLSGGVTGPATGVFRDPHRICNPTVSVPPDPHCLTKSGAAPRGILALLQILRGRRLLFIGDSISGQVANALECALRRTAPEEVGVLQPITVKREVPELVTACNRAWDGVEAGSISKQTYEDSQCRALGAGNFANAARESNATFMTLHGLSAPLHNFSFFRRFGDVYHYNRQLECRLRRPYPAQPECSKSSGRYRLPTHVELVGRHNLADIIVLNFGLHAGDPDAYRAGMQKALHDLQAFAGNGRASVIRETSAQHFPVRSGDYNEAIAKDPKLVLANNQEAEDARDRKKQWLGPSMCKPLGQNISFHWRNRIVHELMKEPGHERVRLQPFEMLTRSRWDYHASIKYSHGQWRSDCTHWCWSPCFWERHFSDLQRALRGFRRLE